MSEIFLRYNTHTKGPSDRWRVIIDGEETLVGHFEVKDGARMYDKTTLEFGVVKFNVCVDGVVEHHVGEDGIVTAIIRP